MSEFVSLAWSFVQNLAVIFNDLFGGVVYAGLDTDKHKYPIGSGRVTFNNSKSYMKVPYTPIYNNNRCKVIILSLFICFT